jgi:uncharacterized phiE125 gp8 family phage protein
MSTRLVTGTKNAPVDLATALRFCRALEQDVDMVWLLLIAATEKLEDYTGRSLITKTFCLEMDRWPDFNKAGTFEPEWIPGINLPRTPLSAIDFVKYYYNGTLTTWATTNYRTDTARIPGRLVLADNITFPSVDLRHDTIQIQFQAGYGTTPGTIPSTLRTAVLMLTHHWFDNRIPVDIARGVGISEIPMSLRDLLHAYKVETTK